MRFEDFVNFAVLGSLFVLVCASVAKGNPETATLAVALMAVVVRLVRMEDRDASKESGPTSVPERH